MSVNFSLTFVNPGRSALTIDSITTSCDCAVVGPEAYKSRSVKSGESLSVPVELKTGKYAGRFRQAISLRTAEGNRHDAHVQLDVRGTWAVSHDEINFGEVRTGDPAKLDPIERVLSFRSSVDRLAAPIESPVPWLHCVTELRDAELTEVRFRVDPLLLPRGVSTASIPFFTTSPIRPDGSVFVRVRAVPALIAVPEVVPLVRNEPIHVSFRQSNGDPAVLLSWQCPESFHVETAASDSLTIRWIGPDPSTCEMAVTDERGCVVPVTLCVFR